MKVQVFECLRCEKEWTRKPVRGQRPKFCPECRAESRGNGWRQVECQTCHRPFWVGVSARPRRYCTPECAPQKPTKPSKPLGYYPTREEFETYRYSYGYLLDHRDAEGLRRVLESKVVKNADGCWLWQGYTRGGYGKVNVRRRRMSVHVYVYRVVHGDIPKGDHVHHRCGESTCVNPDHLALSTARENVGEMLARRAYEARLAHAEDLLRRFAAELPEDHPLVIEWRTTTSQGIASSAA